MDTTFGKLISAQVHTAYAKVADAAHALGYFRDTDHRKMVGDAVGRALTVFEVTLREMGIYDIPIDSNDSAAILAKAAGRVIDGMETRLGRQFSDVEVDGLFKAIVNRPSFSKAGSQDVDLWGSGGKGATAAQDTAPGRHNPTSDAGMGYNGNDGHPDYEYSRPLEDEDRLRRFIGKTTLGMDDQETSGSILDPTAFRDETGVGDDDGPAEPMREADTDPPTRPAEPVTKSDPSQDPPLKLEVSDMFRDAPAVDAEVQSKQRSEPYIDSDQRQQPTNPINREVGSIDAVAVAQLHRTMYRRAIRSKKFDLAVVQRNEDGSVEILKESLR